MRPHPLFMQHPVPRLHQLGPFTLRALSIADLERDFAAVMASADAIKAAHPGSKWPDGLTREQNLIDLAWHQKEFETRRSFAWVIEDAENGYLGCLYVYPSLAGKAAADVRWWWRTGTVLPDTQQRFRDLVALWLASADWPRLDYRMQDG